MGNKAPIKIVLFMDGTVSSDKDNPPSLLGKIASYFMHFPENSLFQLYTNCKEPYKYYFSGPGSDICEDDKTTSLFTKIISSIIGTLDGHYGANGIENQLQRIKAILLKHAEEAKKNNTTLELHIFSYSRGGFLAWRLKKELADLIEKYKIPIASLNMFNIDPVPGSPFDRIRLFLHGQKEDPKIKITSTTYLSDTGNLHWWPFRKINTVLFSSLLENLPGYLTFLVPANHEGIIGRLKHRLAANHPENLGCEGVLGHIAETTTIKLKSKWKKTTIQKGKIAINKTIKKNLEVKYNRRHLNGSSVWSSFFGHFYENLQPITTLAQHDTNDHEKPSHCARI